MAECPRIRLVGADGRDYPAWAVGGCVVFRVDVDQAIEGRRWFAFDSCTGRLMETVARDEAFRFAEYWNNEFEALLINGDPDAPAPLGILNL